MRKRKSLSLKMGHLTGSISRIGSLLVQLLLAGSLTVVFVMDSGVNIYSEAPFAQMLDGTANQPFVGRQFVPMIIRLGGALVPAKLRHQIVNSGSAGGPLEDLAITFHISADLLPEGLIAIGLFFAAFLGYGRLLAAIFRSLYEAPPFVFAVVPLLAMIALPPLFSNSYIYDPAVLVLVAATMYFLVKDRLPLLYCAFLAALINKETAVLLGVVVALFGWKSRWPQSRLKRTLAILGAIWVAVTLGRWIAFHDNPGLALRWGLGDQIAYFLRTYPFQWLVTWLVIGLLVVARWPERPLLLRSWAAIFSTAFRPLFDVRISRRNPGFL